MRYAITYLLFLLLSSACTRQATPPQGDTLPKSVRSIAVLPAGVMAETGSQSPSASVAKELTAGVTVLDQIVAEVLQSNPKVNFLSEEEIDAHSKSYSASSMAQALEIGKSVGAEAVMIWGLVRYRQRTGGDYGVQTPAAVGFEYRLIHTESGQTLCAASFEETQKSATDNLLAFSTVAKRGFKWVPAEVLLREGVNKKILDCEYLKVSSDQEAEAPPVVEGPSRQESSVPAVVETSVPEKAAPAEPSLPPSLAPSPAKEEAAKSAPGLVAEARAEEVSRFLNEWRQAWEATAGPQGEMERYGAFYAPDFRNRKQNRSLWLSDKRRNNRGKEWIKLEISELTISAPSDSPLLEVSFTQEYASSNYSETSRKSLVLRKNGTDWEIVAER